MTGITLDDYIKARAVLYEGGHTTLRTRLVTLLTAQPCAAFYHAVSSVENIEAGTQAVQETAWYKPEATCIECMAESTDLSPRKQTRYTCFTCVNQALRDIAIDAMHSTAGTA